MTNTKSSITNKDTTEQRKNLHILAFHIFFSAFSTRSLHFYFLLHPTNYVASPDQMLFLYPFSEMPEFR